MQAGSASSVFPDLAICDVCLFSCRKNELVDLHADDGAELLREMQGIFTAIGRTEVKNALGTGSNDMNGLPWTKVNTILNNKSLHSYFSFLMLTFANSEDFLGTL
jgi:hypothetical protein